MDKELEIKRQFLDEAQEYLDDLDTAFLGMADQKIDPSKINAALRAAHSIKGGAGMMQFTVLSDLAHRIEDSLKVLKIQRDNPFDGSREFHASSGQPRSAFTAAICVGVDGFALVE
jgi:two-component system, chemotaxis family, sensor histidine kinase and response regulator PixL